MKGLIIASVLMVAVAMMATAVPNLDRPIRSADLAHIQELLKEMAEERELEEDHSQEMCIDQNDEVECTCIQFKGKKHPLCMGPNCAVAANPAIAQRYCPPGMSPAWCAIRNVFGAF
ncbi:uncharacterized protein LOC135347992 [Halichondria panicea]|uniref:uncharacterized protein LOC135347992 n=1 Tax=Halichondria panicea TaxID=6063 RepID=UPI00312BA69C